MRITREKTDGGARIRFDDGEATIVAATFFAFGGNTVWGESRSLSGGVAVSDSFFLEGPRRKDDWRIDFICQLSLEF